MMNLFVQLLPSNGVTLVSRLTPETCTLLKTFYIFNPPDKFDEEFKNYFVLQIFRRYSLIV